MSFMREIFDLHDGCQLAVGNLLMMDEPGEFIFACTIFQ